MASAGSSSNLLKNLRIVTIATWEDYKGAGFNLESGPNAPFSISSIDSNSPAAASGLKINDVVIEVNGKDVLKTKYDDLKKTIGESLKSKTVELLVIDRTSYTEAQKQKVKIDKKSAKKQPIIKKMPDDYKKFPKNTPRFCQVRLNPGDSSFGFDLVAAPGEVGAIIQTIIEKSPAAKTGLRPFDRIVEIDGEPSDEIPHSRIREKVMTAKKRNAIDLLVVDSGTYKHFKEQQMPFKSGPSPTRSTPTPTKPDDADGDRQRPAREISSTNPPDDFIDIRLCKIEKRSAGEDYGISLKYHKNERYHTLSLAKVDNENPSRAQLAGILDGDHLIEVDGENVQNLDDAAVKKKIKNIKFPDPLNLLVVNAATFTHFQKKKLKIHSKLPEVRKLPVPTGSRRPSRSTTRPGSTAPGIRDLVGRDILAGQSPARESPSMDTAASRSDSTLGRIVNPKHRICRVVFANDNAKLGMTINNKEPEGTPHRILTIQPSSLAEEAGLRENDIIISINDQPVRDLRREEMTQLLKTSVATAMKSRKPMVFVVTDEMNSEPEPKKSSRRPTSTSMSRSRSPYEQPMIGQTVNPQHRICRVVFANDNAKLGVSINNKEPEGTPHRILTIQPSSLAEEAGLRENDIIISINDQPVRDLRREEMTQLLKTSVATAMKSRKPMVFVVMDEYSGRISPASSERTVASGGRRSESRHTVPLRRSRSPSLESPDTSGRNISSRGAMGVPDSRPSTPDSFPEMRLFIIPVSKRRAKMVFDLGGNNRFIQIKKITVDYDRVETGIRADDILVEVNEENVDGEPQYRVANMLEEAKSSQQDIKLLFIDKTGYEWYQQKRIRISSHDDHANITKKPVDIENSEDEEGHEGEVYPVKNQITTPIYEKPSNYAGDENGHYGKPLDREIVTNSRNSEHFTSLVEKPRSKPSRTLVDVVSGKYIVRACALKNKQNETLGLVLSAVPSKYTIKEIIKNSPAECSGLKVGDKVISIDDYNLIKLSEYDVNTLIEDAEKKGNTVIFVQPQEMVDDHLPSNVSSYAGFHARETYLSPVVIPKSESNRRDRAKTMTDAPTSLALNYPNSTDLPTEPIPRECVMQYNENFQGWGFRIIEKSNMDTPIVVDVLPDSPAKRSGLTAGDHILYIDRINVQGIEDLNELVSLIQDKYKKKTHLSLVVLTNGAYRVLKKKGGQLSKETFTYDPNITNIRPRLCKLNLDNYEYDFGFSLYRENVTVIREVRPHTVAAICDVRTGDKIIEINGFNTSTLSTKDIQDMIHESKQNRRVTLLLIDKSGYEYCHRHAIPINSDLPFVDTICQQPTLHDKISTTGVSL